MMALDVGYMPKKRIARRAQELIDAFAGDREGDRKAPINVELIAERHLGLGLEIEDLSARLGVTGVLGAVWFDEGIVRIDEGVEHDGRYAFTLAHELGHWVLHRPLWESKQIEVPLFSLDGAEPTPAVVCRSDKKPQAEWQADYFASCLLMPEPLVRETIAELYGRDLPRWEGFNALVKEREYDPDLAHVASVVIEAGGFDNVSKQAMGIRLKELALVGDASDPVQETLF
jgi:hypothetical protein